MSRFALAFCCMLTGCTYLGTAREWDPGSAEGDFLLIPDLCPIRQQDSVGCGPAALTMVLRYYGESISVEDVSRELVPDDERGVPARSLRDLARDLGYKAHLIEGSLSDLEEHLRKGRPLIVGLVKPYVRGALPHYEVVVGFHPVQQSVATLDPARGWTLNTAEGFLEEWAASGRLLLVIAPAPVTP